MGNADMDITKEGPLSGQMDKEGDDLHEAMCTLVKADEIRADKELMKKLEPHMAEHVAKVEKSMSLRDFHKKALADALAKEDEEKESKKHELGESKDFESGEDEAEMESKKAEARTKVSPKIASRS